MLLNASVAIQMPHEGTGLARGIVAVPFVTPEGLLPGVCPVDCKFE